MSEIKRYELKFDLADESDATIWAALERLTAQRRAAHFVRDALRAALLGGGAAAPAPRSYRASLPGAALTAPVMEESPDADMDAFMASFG